MDSRHSRAAVFLLATLAFIFTTACTAPRMEGGTLAGKSAILDAVYSALTREDCTTAIANIEGLYASAYSDNDVRLARASAQGCAASVSNMTALVMSLADHGSALGGTGFWELMTQMFTHSTASVLDTRIAAASNAVDALFAAVRVGTVVAAQNQMNPDTFNVGSLLVDDRLADANLYLVFIAMALIGELQNRYGAPTAEFKRGQILGATGSNANGWTKYDKVDESACLYASSIINLLDGIDAVQEGLSGRTSRTMGTIASAFGEVVDEACDMGCRGEDTLLVPYSATGCGAPLGLGFDLDHGCKGVSGSRPCLTALRDPHVCTTDPTSETARRAQCAAAGIALFISTHPAGWQGP